MTAVIDASALVAFCLNEKGLDREKMEEYLREGVLSIELIKAESANAFLESRRRDIVDEKTAKAGFEGMLELCKNNIKMVPQDDELISAAFEIGKSTSNLAIYGLLYLSLAKKLDAILVSRDENQSRLAKRLGIRTADV